MLRDGLLFFCAMSCSDRLTKSEGVIEPGSVPEVLAQMQQVPVQFKRLEKFNIVSVCGEMTA